MGTRAIVEKDFVNHELLKKDIKRLENEKKGIILSINTQNKKLSDLVDEEIKIKVGNDKLISIAKSEATVIIDEAKIKRKKATELEADARGKIAQADSREQEASNLIKSNQGKEKNLIGEKKETKSLKEKLNNIVEMIKNVF